jgi:hypothetical protein
MIPTRRAALAQSGFKVFGQDHAQLDAYQLSLKTFMLIACGDRYH